MKKGAGNARYNEDAIVEDPLSLTFLEIEVLVAVLN